MLKKIKSEHKAFSTLTTPTFDIYIYIYNFILPKAKLIRIFHLSGFFFVSRVLIGSGLYDQRNNLL